MATARPLGCARYVGEGAKNQGGLRRRHGFLAIKGLLLQDGCADVFQLLGRQNKTGLLRLRAVPQSVDIWLTNGLVVRAEDRTREESQRLGEMLVRASLLTRAQLTQALERQARGKKRMGHVLLETGLVPQRQLADFIRLQTRETLFNAFMMKRGTYEFLPGVETTPAPELAPGLRWEHALMEGVRRAAEWPIIRKAFPTNAYMVHVLRPLTEPPRSKSQPSDEANFLGLEEENSGLGTPDFPSPELQQVFDLLRPGTTVQQVVDQSRMGEFTACSLLLNLHTEGYVDFLLEEMELQDLDDVVVEDESSLPRR